MEGTHVGIIQRWLFTGTRRLAWLFPQALWRVPTTEKVLYLTFDDGPVPEVTPWVLAQLAQYQAKATFFVIGDNVRKYPEVFKSILAQGHTVGNHTENHLRGSQYDVVSYLANVEKCQRRLPEHTRGFRPPYGRLSFRQYRRLSETYQIVFWDVLSQDYDPTLSPEACFVGTFASIRPGSIVVFHDSVKAWPRLSVVLPRFLEVVKAEGYRLEKLDLDVPPIR